MSNLYALDETLDMLNGTNYTSFEGLAEAVLIESRDFCSFIESQNIILEKIDFSKIKEKAKQAWERIKAKIKALVAKIEYWVKEAINITKRSKDMLKLLPSKVTVKSAINMCKNLSVFGIKNIKEIKNPDSTINSINMDDILEHIGNKHIKVKVLDTNIISKNMKNVSGFVDYCDKYISEISYYCDRFEELTKNYFKTYGGYEDSDKLAFSKYDLSKPEFDQYDIAHGDIESDKIPETFLVEKEFSSIDIDDYLGETGDYIETYIDIVGLRTKSSSIINKINMLVKSGDNIINKINSELHAGESDPTFRLNLFLKHCSELISSISDHLVIVSKYEAYYKKLYKESIESVVVVMNIIVKEAIQYAAEVKAKETNK